MENSNQRKTPLFAEVSVRNEKRPMLAEQRTVPFSFSEGAFTGNLRFDNRTGIRSPTDMHPYQGWFCSEVFYEGLLLNGGDSATSYRRRRNGVRFREREGEKEGRRIWRRPRSRKTQSRVTQIASYIFFRRPSFSPF